MLAKQVTSQPPPSPAESDAPRDQPGKLRAEQTAEGVQISEGSGEAGPARQEKGGGGRRGIKDASAGQSKGEEREKLGPTGAASSGYWVEGVRENVLTGSCRAQL